MPLTFTDVLAETLAVTETQCAVTEDRIGIQVVRLEKLLLHGTVRWHGGSGEGNTHASLCTIGTE